MNLRDNGRIFPDATAAVDKEWEKLETIPAWDLEEVKSKKEVVLQAQRGEKKVHFATLMDICHHKNAELGPKITEVHRQESCSEGLCKRRLWSLRSLH